MINKRKKQEKVHLEFSNEINTRLKEEEEELLLVFCSVCLTSNNADEVLC